MYNKVNQLYIYIYPLFFRFFSHITRGQHGLSGDNAVRMCRPWSEATAEGTPLCYESTPPKDLPLLFCGFFLFEHDPCGTKKLVKILVETAHSPKIFFNTANCTKYSLIIKAHFDRHITKGWFQGNVLEDFLYKWQLLLKLFLNS